MKILVDAPRWIILAALLFAPWFYGGTTEQGILAIIAVTGVAVLLWLALLPFQKHGERQLPWLLFALVASTLALGWWSVLNARTIYDGDFAAFVPVPALIRIGAGSVDQVISAAWMLRATALLGTLCLVAEACRDLRWAWRFCLTSATAGGSIALLGLIQKATRAPMIFWREVDQPVSTFFATFYYHGNAGAFLNLTFPITAGLAYRAFVREERPLARAGWSAAFLVNLVAVFANTSRAGHAIALGMLLLLAAGLVRRMRVDWRIGAVAAVAFLLAIYAITRASAVDQSLSRWTNASATMSADARWVSSRAALRALPDAAWFGFGPGTFHVIFPYYTAGLGERLNGFWRYLHEDYLQTLMEWGVIGSALWAGIFFGGIATALRTRYNARAKEWRPRQRLLLTLVVLALGSVGVHALVDFPLQIASIELYVAVYLGICWSSPSWTR